MMKVQQDDSLGLSHGEKSKASAVLEYFSGEATVKAREIDGEFFVFKGSVAL